MSFKLELDQDTFNELIIDASSAATNSDERAWSQHRYAFDLSVGEVRLKENVLGEKKWRTGQMTFSTDLSLFGELTAPKVEIYICLGGIYQAAIAEHKDQFQVLPNHFSLSYSPNPTGKCFVHADVSNQFFELNITERELFNLGITTSPTYEQLLRAISDRKAFTVAYTGILLPTAILNIVRQIQHPPVHSNFSARYLAIKIEELMIMLLQECDQRINSTSSKVAIRDQKKIAKAVAYIEAYHQQFPTLDHIAKAAGVCKSKLCADFKSIYGYPVIEYCQDLRMNRAKRMLTQADQTIAEIAFEVGYKNPQHFTTAFKKRFGYPPSRLRA